MRLHPTVRSHSSNTVSRMVHLASNSGHHFDASSEAHICLPPPPANPVEAVELLLRSLAAGRSNDRLGHIVCEHLGTGGKRLRVRLALGACAALGVSEEAAIPWAAACELLHNASLIHDDLQDGDTVRRGHPTTWARYGMPQAVNAGDLLLMLPFAAIDHPALPDASRWPLGRALARYAETTVRGQAAELDLLRSQRLDPESYLAAVAGKTSALFALPVFGALLLAGRASDALRLSAPFEELGTLFQLQDDVIDLYGEKGRGERGADIREGKVSALVVEHLSRQPNDRQRLVEILSKSRERTTSDEVAWAALRFEQSGAVDAVLDRIHSMAERARVQLAGEAPLLAAADELIARSIAPLTHLPGRLKQPSQSHARTRLSVAHAV